MTNDNHNQSPHVTGREMFSVHHEGGKMVGDILDISAGCSSKIFRGVGGDWVYSFLYYFTDRKKYLVTASRYNGRIYSRISALR